MSRRLQRLNVLFREELAALVSSELRDPRLTALTSVTRVDISPDLENANVYVSMMGDEEAKGNSMAALRAAAPFLRHRLLERVHIRRLPTLHFVLDETIEEAAHVLDLMRQVSEKGSESQRVKASRGSEGQGVRGSKRERGQRVKGSEGQRG